MNQDGRLEGFCHLPHNPRFSDFSNIKPFCFSLIKPSFNVLVVGPGHSTLAEELYDRYLQRS
jgi:hypothetical protein